MPGAPGRRRPGELHLRDQVSVRLSDGRWHPGRVVALVSHGPRRILAQVAFEGDEASRALAQAAGWPGGLRTVPARPDCLRLDVAA